MSHTAGRNANRLIHSTSPYLLQHAYNPVDWFEWGKEALEKARAENKPLLVSIGYSSCHWCHVMERESFEHEEIAAIMNEHFVCIKVDREERPDIDHLYMEAVQAMGLNGGWPLNVFLTPDQKPFYGGTYFPPQNWARLLLQINQVFHQKRSEVDRTAEDLSNHLQTSDLARFAKDPDKEIFDITALDRMAKVFSDRFDNTWGGIEKAPKFVMPTIWMFLLRHFSITGQQHSLDMVTRTLRQMASGGLYDQVGGGFSRYSVDKEWFAPHFEKMLYDNAQLLTLYAEAYSATGDDLFRKVVYETVEWLEREMTHPDGGFYSALDADSEGMEGKFYTWTLAELKDALGEQAELVADYFHATAAGNWEHGRNILKVSHDDRVTAKYGIDEREQDALIVIARKKLLEARNKRIRPGLDDKILTGWNAMTITGLLDCYRFFEDDRFLTLPLRNIAFIETNLVIDGRVCRAYKNKAGGTEGFLEDYAWLIQAYKSLYEATFDEAWLRKAEQWCAYVLENFFDIQEGYFHFSSARTEPLIAKKKEVFDNVIPSANSVMARNLYHLGIMLDRQEWKELAVKMCSRLASMAVSEPAYMSNWGMLFAEIAQGMAEVVIVGPEASALRRSLQRHYLPFMRTLGTSASSDLSLLQGREVRDGKTMIFVCFNKTCKLPVTSVEEAMLLINNR